MILLLDHDDSFVHTLADYLRVAGADAVVWRTRATTLAAIRALAPRGIVLSPGPGSPADHPLSGMVVRELGPTIPILGVCLGHQIIASAHGATVRRSGSPRHGRTSLVRHDGAGVFLGAASPFTATRYHSLAVDATSLPPDLVATAWAEDDEELMGVRHRHRRVEGVQFHPEALLTEGGLGLMTTWIRSVRDTGGSAPP